MTTNARKWRFTRLTLAATALLVAGGVGEATGAVTAVQRALLADNAVKVNGIKASRKAHANYLVALGKDGRFPASTMNPDAAPGRTYYGVVGFEGTAPAGTVPDGNGVLDPAADGGSQTYYKDAGGVAVLRANPYWIGGTITLPRSTKPIQPGDVSIAGGGIENADCTGTYANPTAPVGLLCIYPGAERDNDPASVTDPTTVGDVATIDAEVLNVFKNGEGALDATPYLIGNGTTGVRIEVQAGFPRYVHQTCTDLTSPMVQDLGNVTIDQTDCTTKDFTKHPQRFDFSAPVKFTATWAYTAPK
jgi:hypothetical protein